MTSFVNKFWFGLIVVLIVVSGAFVRLYHLTDLPVSPYWEEVALGYDAFSIAKTARDHHGQFLPLVAFESFGDWKPALYFYLIIPFIWLIGLSVWAVRLPAALCGLALMAAIGTLTALTGSSLPPRERRVLFIFGLGVAAVSPWLLLFSRGGWEVNAATTMATWGMVIGLTAVDQNKRLSLGKVVSATALLIASMYTYHGLRMTAPLLGIGLAWWWANQLRWQAHHLHQEGWKIIVAGVVALILAAPLLGALRSNQITQRFAETSIVADTAIIELSNSLKDQAGQTLVSKVLYHRYVIYAYMIGKNVLLHFDPTFLFISGDINPRHSVSHVGILYYLDAFLLLIGGWSLLRQRTATHKLLLWWLVVGILPAALTKAVPHALRTLPAAPVYLTVVALGWYQLWQFIAYKGYEYMTVAKVKWVTITQVQLSGLILFAMSVVYLGQFGYFWRTYTTIYAQTQGHEWQYGYKEVIALVHTAQQKYPYTPIQFSRHQGRPAMYYWFYSQTDPNLVQTANATVSKDQGEFLTFESIQFVNGLTPTPNTILVAPTSFLTEMKTQGKQVDEIGTVIDKQGKPLWSVFYLMQ